ncbi:MAG TPA: hypothetical protein VHZ54_09800 [Solirubrobacterales bacterium]|jgi:hypothetical protein|nr:hypothetical protein [Solirubrobacterales bacterium]
MANEDGAEGLAAWAAAHGLAVEDGVHLPRTTPLLAEGEVHAVDALAGGWLSQYVEAKIALIERDGANFTVAVTHVPKAKRFVPWMLCHRTDDRHLLGLAATRLIGGGSQIDLGSAEFDQHYRVYAAPQRDDVWFHELFSPAFIVFLIELAPKGLAFEYVEGTLCVSLLGGPAVADDLDAVRDATVELVRRIRAEISERLGPAQSARSAPEPTGLAGEAPAAPPQTGPEIPPQG